MSILEHAFDSYRSHRMGDQRKIAAGLSLPHNQLPMADRAKELDSGLPRWMTVPKSFFWLGSVVLLIWNMWFYSQSTVVRDPNTAPPYAQAQLAWLRDTLDEGNAERMQSMFPEGWLFCYALYGLAWVELALREPELSSKALGEARWAMAHIESPQGKESFPPDLKPDHGMFYSAWRNHLLAGILLIQPPEERDLIELQQFRRRCDQFADLLRTSPTPFPPSYRGLSWPCDTLPAIHSLVISDSMMKDEAYSAVIRNWLATVKEKTESGTGLLPHTAEIRYGDPSSEARATSQTIILRFLRDIDPAWAQEQYLKFREQFFVTRLGIPAIREYPPPINKPGDIDSGPLITGVSTSATVVGMGVASVYGDYEFAQAISQVGEAIGVPFGHEKRAYLGGYLPVADAFLVHASTARPWLEGTVTQVVPLEISPFWRCSIHLISMIVWFLTWKTFQFISLIAVVRRRSQAQSPCFGIDPPF